MKAKAILLVTFLGAWTVLVYSTLFILGQSGVDPVVIVPSPLPEFLRHGKPVLNPVGIITWLAILITYAAGSLLGSSRLVRARGRKQLVAAFLILFTVSTAFVMLVHPTLLLTLLGEEGRESYSRFIHRNVPFLDEIYFHWGLFRFKYLVVLGQVLLALAVIAPLLIRRRGSTLSSDRAQG